MKPIDVISLTLALKSKIQIKHKHKTTMESFLFHEAKFFYFYF